MSSSSQFYSRFSLQGSQPYLLTHEYSQKGMNIPGMTWVPDFSLWNINHPERLSPGPVMNLTQNSLVCKKYPGASCGYQFWKTQNLQ